MSKLKIVATPLDEDNMGRYLQERMKLLEYRRLLLLAPHIASHFIVKIRAATLKDYTFTNKFRDSAIIVEITHSRASCEAINCVPVYPRGQTCKPTDPPKIFKSGDDTWVGCDPACFNLKLAPQNDRLQMQPVYFSTRLDSCILCNMQHVLVSIDDTIRAEKPTSNITTIGTGFNQSEKMYIDPAGNEMTLFEINKYYCDHFNLNFIKKNGLKQCDTSVGQDVVGFLIGEYIYQMFAFGAKFVTTGRGITSTSLPDVGPPDSLPAYKTNTRAWKENIRPGTLLLDCNVKLSELGIFGATRHMTWTNEFDPSGSLIEPVIVATSKDIAHSSSGFVQTPVDWKAPAAIKIDYTLRTNHFTKKVPAKLKIDDVGFRFEKTPSKQGFSEDLSQFLESEPSATAAVIKSLFSVDSLFVISAALVQSDVEKLVKRTFKHVMKKKVTPLIFQGIEKYGHKVGSRMLLSVARTIGFQMTRKQFIAVTSKALISITKVGAFALNTVSWALAVSVFVDIILSIIDPFNLNAKMGPDVLLTQAKAALKANQKEFETENREFTIDELSLLMCGDLSEEVETTLMAENLKLFEKHALANHNAVTYLEFALTHSSEYFSSFKTNSNGSRYDWESDIERIDNENFSQLLEVYNDASLAELNHDVHFASRLKHQTKIKNYTIGALVLVGGAGITYKLGGVLFYLSLLVLLVLVVYLNSVMFAHDAYIDKIANLQYEFFRALIV